jgi:hypothetical protein
MYLTVIPMIYTGGMSATFTIMLDNVHLPYDYDLPNYYIYFIAASSGAMTSSNQFLMTNSGIFYQCPLNSLTISCLDNSVGVLNTICTINFGTQNPLAADGKINLVFSGMTIATNVCYFYINSSLVPSNCKSTQNDTTLVVTLLGTSFYPAGNFTLVIAGVGISSTSISNSLTLYLYDVTDTYVIESGNRILTTTIAP